PDRELTFANNRVNTRDVPAHGAQPSVVLELSGGRLEAQVEQFLFRLTQFLLETFIGETVKRGHVQILGPDSHVHSPPSRRTMRAFSGSLWIARRSASSATASDTPANSKSTRPGLTFATHHSGEPLPDPIRVSAGFLVSGRSGKMLIHTFPPRLM